MNIEQAKRSLHQIVAINFGGGYDDVFVMLKEEIAIASNFGRTQKLAEYGVGDFEVKLQNLLAAIQSLIDHDCDLTKMTSQEKSALGNCAIIIDGLIKSRNGLSDDLVSALEPGNVVNEELKLISRTEDFISGDD